MSTIDTSWEDPVAGPFKDNHARLIAASSVRAFAAAIRTQQIASSTGLVWAGAYAGGTTYHLNDLVTSGGALYYSGGTQVGVAPPGGTWVLLAGSGAVSYGTTAGTAAEGNDARLSDQRVPTNASVTAAKIVGGGLPTSAITGTAVITTDARLSDQRVPTNASVTDAKISGTLSPSKIAGTAVVGVVDNTKLATMANLTVKGNTSDAPALPSDIPMVQLAGMLSGKLAASDIAADNTGGVTGPSVATALVALATALANGNKFQ